jgi:hypothetical protein
MTPAELFNRAAALGLRLEARGDRLAVIPADRLPADFREVLAAHKAELLAWLTPPCPGFGAVPPADLPLIPVAPRPTPARRERVLAYLLRQGADRPGPLAGWLERRACAYFDGNGRRWDCALHAYAAARDAACWQLARSEADVWQFLEAADEAASCRKPKTQNTP